LPIQPSKPLPIILGVDPGTRVAGYAFLQAKNNRPMSPRDYRVIDAGALKADIKLTADQRIGLMHEGLFQLIDTHKPIVLAMEQAFYDKNVSTAIRLGEVRGAFIAAATRGRVPVAGITPAEVKRLVAGNGRATKEQVCNAVKALMGFDKGNLPFDVTDAVAIALAHGLNNTFINIPLSNAQRSRANEISETSVPNS